MKLTSTTAAACIHTATGAEIPAAGQEFETDEATGATLIEAGLAKKGKAAKAAKIEEDADGAR